NLARGEAESFDALPPPSRRTVECREIGQPQHPLRDGGLKIGLVRHVGVDGVGVDVQGRSDGSHRQRPRTTRVEQSEGDVDDLLVVELPWPHALIMVERTRRPASTRTHRLHSTYPMKLARSVPGTCHGARIPTAISPAATKPTPALNRPPRSCGKPTITSTVQVAVRM